MSSGTPPAAITPSAGRPSRPSRKAHEQIAKLIGACAKEIIFTSGATESNNLALKGVAEVMYRERGNHIITQATEHKAVLDTCKRLEKQGFRITYLPVQADGLIDIEDLKRAMDDQTILVSIMYASNEIGVIQPVQEIGKLCHEKSILFHTDAVQAVGKVPVNVQTDNIDILSPLRPQDPAGRKVWERCMSAAAITACRSPSRSSGGGPRLRHAVGHPQCAGHCRIRKSLRALYAGDGIRGQARAGARATT